MLLSLLIYKPEAGRKQRVLQPSRQCKLIVRLLVSVCFPFDTV